MVNVKNLRQIIVFTISFRHSLTVDSTSLDVITVYSITQVGIPSTSTLQCVVFACTAHHVGKLEGKH